MIKQNIRNVATELKFHPSLVPIKQLRKRLADAYPALLLRLNPPRRRALLREFETCDSVRSCMDFASQHMRTGSCQIPSEIESALAAMRAARPKVICEIGTFDGGTSLLLARFIPTLRTLLCVDLYVKNKSLLGLLAPQTLRLQFFDMPSSAPKTLVHIAQTLGGQEMDVLFIDGDHRYEGVKQDFLSYRQFVRDGGLIVFHDIVEAEPGGEAWVGGVPRLWQQLARVYSHQEFVSNRDQQGFGIGILRYSRSVALPAPLAG